MKRKNKIRYSILIVLAILLLLIFRHQWMRWQIKEPLTDASGLLKVHFIDAGQSDCILVQSEDQNLLIDAGDNLSGGEVVDYLRSQGITYLDYVIGTHGHHDHIGGMDAVLYNFEVGEFFLPKQQYDTHIYTDMLDAAKARGIPVTIPKFMEMRTLGTAKFIFVALNPKGEYEDVNDSSLGIRVSNGTHSFLMCGDISKEMESEMVKSGIYLKSDVMKLNHHGSSDTNSKKFLKYVNPDYAVACCGRNNGFGHPHPSVLKRLKRLNIELFRTDEQGTIVFTSDGERLVMQCDRN